MTPLTLLADWTDTVHGTIDSLLFLALLSGVTSIVTFVERRFKLSYRAARVAYVIGAAVLGVLSVVVYRAGAAEKIGAIISRYIQ
jgi:hypothetical protein